MSFFTTKGSSKNKFDGIIDSGFKAVVLAGFVSVSVACPMMIFITRDAIALAFDANMMSHALYFVAGFSFFCVLALAYVAKTVANAYVKAQALNAMASKNAQQTSVQPQIMVMPQVPQMTAKEAKKAAKTWALPEMDKIEIIDGASVGSSDAGKPFVF